MLFNCSILVRGYTKCNMERNSLKTTRRTSYPGDERKARENVGPRLNEVGDLVTQDTERQCF